MNLIILTIFLQLIGELAIILVRKQAEFSITDTHSSI